MAVVLRQPGDERRQVLRELILVLGRIGEQHLRDALRLACGLRNGLRALPRDEDVNVSADLLRRAKRMQRRGLEGRVVVLGDDEDGHQITLASFLSFSTSAFASGTLMPLLRFAGSSTFSVAMRGVTSTPSASGFSVSSGFFFAFMMLGSVT